MAQKGNIMDNTNFSLSDLAAVTNGGLGGESIWVILLFFLLVGGNGFGIGRNTAEDAVGNEILSGQKFDALSRQINQVGDGLCSSTYNLNNSIMGVQTNLGNAITSEGRAIQTQLCAINSNIDNKFAAMEKSALEQKIAEQSQAINQLQMSQMLCGIPKVNNTAWGVYPYANTGCGCTGLATI